MAADLAQFRERLKASCRHLVERIAEEDDHSREIANEVMTEVRDRRRRKREADEADDPGLNIIGSAPEPQGLRAVPQQGAAP